MGKRKQVKEEKKKKSAEDKTKRAKTPKSTSSRTKAKTKTSPKSPGRKTSAKTPGTKKSATRKTTTRRKTKPAGTKPKKKSTPKTRARKKPISSPSLFSDTMSVESAKFEVEPPARSTPDQYPPRGKERDLPEHYGDTRVVLLVRDPEWIFSYWEINDQTRSEHDLTKGQHEKTLSLRVYDVTDIEFDGANAHRYYDVIINDYANSWYLRVPEVKRRWCVDLGYYHQETGDFIPLARSNAVKPPSGVVSAEQREEWMQVTGEQYEEILRVSGGLDLQDVRGSENIMREISEKLKVQVEQAQGASGALASGRMEEQAPRAKDFWLTVNTDLIVYGATEPGATLTIQGKAIPLRSDGTFSVRFSLPDGTRIMPVHATSADGKSEREIIPQVKKETH